MIPARRLRPALALIALLALGAEARAQISHTVRSALFVLDLSPPALALALPALQEPAAGGSVMIDATPTGGNGTLVYQWYFNGRPIPAEQGGTSPGFTIPGHAVNNGAWRVVVSGADQSAEAVFEVRVPGAAASRFALSVDSLDPVAGELALSFPAAFGRTYALQQSADLVNWTTVESDIRGSGSSILRRRSVASVPRLFFRVVELP